MKMVRLGDVCDLQNGFAFKSNLFKSDGIPVLRISSIQDEQICDNRPVFTDQKDYKENLSKYMVKDGDLLIAMSGATTGKVGFNRTGKKFLLNQRVGKFEPSSKLNIDYLFYFLSTKVQENLEISAGAAQPNLSSKQIKDFVIPLPPVAEQKRIVAILDETFEGISAAVANAEKNLANARELFESHLQAVFTKRGTGWVERPLGRMCERITKGSSPKWQGLSYVEKPGILFVTSENVGEYQVLIEQPKYVEEKFNIKDKKSILKKGDVLTNIVGASIGRTAVFDRDDVANINQAVCLIRCEPNLLNNCFLTYLLNSPVFKQVLHDNEVDNARANLSLGFFSQLLVPTPPLPEQRKIVSSLDSFREETQHLEAIYQQKLDALAELKQAVLQKAFAGELTTHPEQVLQEAVA
jgi:type I restriction enzyme S subunit